MAKRIKFIPELRERLAENFRDLGFDDSMINEGFRRWENNEEPRGIVFSGMFEIFRDVQKQVEQS